MATNKSSSVEDAELLDQAEAQAEDAVNEISDTIDEAEDQLEELVEDTGDSLEDSAEADEFDSETSQEGPDEEPHQVAQEEHFEEERRTSFAGRVLWLLFFLFAGAGLALWGGPKLAPMLPQPLQPLAKYLTPGANKAETEIATLRAEMDERLGALPAPIAQESIDAAITDATAQTQSVLSEKTGALSAELAALSDKVTASDSGEIEARLSSLETQLAGMSAEFSSLKDALGALETSDGGAGELSAEIAAKIAGYAANLEGLKAELAAVSSQNGAIGQRIDEVEAATNRRISEADERAKEVQEVAQTVEQSAELKAALEVVKDKLASGTGFLSELEAVALLAEVDPPVELLNHAEAGITPASTLANNYGDAATAAIRDSIKSDAEEGAVSGFSAFLRSQVVSRSLTPQEGDGTDAVLSRMEAALKAGDLNAALEESSALPEPAAAAMSDWLSKARSRAEALSGFEALKAAIAARS